MQSNRSKILLYISLGFFAVPVVILGASMFPSGMSNLGLAMIFFIMGIPSIIVGAVLAIVSFSLALKDRDTRSKTTESKSTKVIKAILITIIIAALTMPVLYVISMFNAIYS